MFHQQRWCATLRELVIPKRIRQSDVWNAFKEAQSLLGFQDPLNQKALKTVVIVAVDALVGLAWGSRITQKPCLWANGTRSCESAKMLRYTRLKSSESMLDVMVCKGERDPFQTLITAESEGYSGHGIEHTSTSENNDYLWGLFKLLQVPSQVRLFVARISRMEKCNRLQERVAWLINCYPRLLREGDRIFSLVLPTALRDCGNISVHGWERKRGCGGGSLEKLAR